MIVLMDIIENEFYGRCLDVCVFMIDFGLSELKVFERFGIKETSFLDFLMLG